MNKTQKNKTKTGEDNKMNAKNSIVTFALVGLAAGTITWLLLGTKEGRKQLDCANDGIRQLAKSIKKNTKKGLDKASDAVSNARKEADELRSKATSKGKSMLDKADRAVKKSINKAEDSVEDTIRTTKSKV